MIKILWNVKLCHSAWCSQAVSFCPMFPSCVILPNVPKLCHSARCFEWSQHHCLQGKAAQKQNSSWTAWLSDEDTTILQHIGNYMPLTQCHIPQILNLLSYLNFKKYFVLPQKWTALLSMCLYHPVGIYLIKVNTIKLWLAGLWHCVVLEDIFCFCMQNASWRWRQQVPTKFLYPPSRLHSDPTPKTTVLGHSRS